MNPEHQNLLDDLLDTGDAAAQRDAVLNAGSRLLRRRRSARYLRRGLAGAGLAALAVLAINRMLAPIPMVCPPDPGLAATPPTRAVSAAYQITDDELLALFPGTPVGLAKVGGHQRLIFPRPGDETRFIVRLE